MNTSLAKQNLRNDVWDLLDRFTSDFGLSSLTNETFMPKIEVKDNGKTYQICAEVPGLDEKDINVSLRENQLVIEGEKKNESKREDKEKGFYHSEFSYGRFYRAIPLADDIDAENVTASYKNGVLNVEMAKLPEKKSKSKKIEIKSQERLQ